MGTFHQDRGELHGITVVVDTDGPEVFIGRCHEVTPRGVLLLNADSFSAPGEAEARAASKEAWVRKAAEYGVWARIRQVVVPQERVVGIRKLDEISRDQLSSV